MYEARNARGIRSSSVLRLSSALIYQVGVSWRSVHHNCNLASTPRCLCWTIRPGAFYSSCSHGQFGPCQPRKRSCGPDREGRSPTSVERGGGQSKRAPGQKQQPKPRQLRVCSPPCGLCRAKSGSFGARSVRRSVGPYAAGPRDGGRTEPGAAMGRTGSAEYCEPVIEKNCTLAGLRAVARIARRPRNAPLLCT